MTQSANVNAHAATLDVALKPTAACNHPLSPLNERERLYGSFGREFMKSALINGTPNSQESQESQIRG